MEPFGLFRFFHVPPPQSGDMRIHEATYPHPAKDESAEPKKMIEEKPNAFLSFAAAHEARSKRLKKR